MSLKLILGPSGCGKSRKLFEKALEDAAQNPGRQHIILVPEQFTMQTDTAKPLRAESKRRHSEY